MKRPALRRILLGLVRTGPARDISQLNPAEWADLNRLAAQHRLSPLLHALHRDDRTIPEDILTSWQAAHRLAALEAMIQRAELAESCALLDARGYAPIALKGAWLAAQAYPEAALRPMRDIDLLVAPDVVMAAYKVLLEAGYEPAGESEMKLEDVIRLDKHMPPLIAPRGTVIELHHRLWERDGRLDHASPVSDEAAVRARALPGHDGIRYLLPDDLLTHLIVHAVYSHRLDCGPLILTDIDFLLRAAPIDWPRFWSDARANGWRDGARFVLDLTERYRPNPAIDFAADPGDPTPAWLIESASDLLLHELDSRASASLAAASLKDGPARLVARLNGYRKATGEAVVRREMASEGGFLGWAGSRTLRSLRDLSQADVRRQSRQLAALSKWLDQ